MMKNPFGMGDMAQSSGIILVSQNLDHIEKSLAHPVNVGPKKKARHSHLKKKTEKKKVLPNP